MAISGSYAAGDEVIIRDAKIEVDLTPISSSSYAEVTTWGTEVSIDGGDIPTQQVFVFQSDGPVIFDGNRNAWRVTVTCLYTEGSTDPFQNIWDKHEDPDTNYASDLRAMNVRVSPAGGDSGEFQFTTAGGKLVQCTPPAGDAAATTPQLFTFTVEAQSLARAAV